MQIEIRGKGVKITDDIKTYCEKSLSKLDRFTNRPLTAKVMIKTEGKKVKVEVSVPVGPLMIRSEVMGQELNDCVDICAEKLEKQIKNNKHKLVRSLQEKHGISDVFKDTADVTQMTNSPVRIKQYKLDTLTFDEAVTRLEVTDHSFYVYKDESGHACVVYLRTDGEYGLIETE